MTPADVGRVMEIAAGLMGAPYWTEDAYVRALDAGHRPRRIAVVLAEPGTDDVIGFAVASLMPPEAELETIAVAAGRQRHGLGRTLFDVLEKELPAAGVDEVHLEVRASNHQALGFYRSVGFGRTGIRRAYYTDPIEDAVLMRLRLR